MLPTDRIQQIRKSQQVFVCGLVSLLPVIGALPALWAVAAAVQLAQRFRGEWNPAAPHVRWGVALAVLNLGISAIAGSILLLNLMPPFAGS